MRSQKDINAQIAWLEENKENVMPRTAFGDDNQAAIEAQLKVLKDDLDEEDVENLVDEGEFTDHQAESAKHAVDWRDAEDDEAEPIKNWKVLLQT